MKCVDLVRTKINHSTRIAVEPSNNIVDLMQSEDQKHFEVL